MSTRRIPRTVALSAELKKMQLPFDILAPRYERVLAEAQVRHAEILAKLRYLESINPEFWCNMPWSKARAQWEATEGLTHEKCIDPRIVGISRVIDVSSIRNIIKWKLREILNKQRRAARQRKRKRKETTPKDE